MKQLSLSLVFCLAVLLAGCSGKPVLYIYNWGDYVSPEVIKKFEKEYNCKVALDFFDSNESMYAKLKAGGGGYDLIVPSTYMTDMMYDQKMLRELDRSRLPNLKYIDPDYLKKVRDSEMKYSVPYLVSFTGIGYNKKKIRNFEPSWRMFEREDIKGRCVLLNDPRQAIGAALITLGYDPNTRSEEEIGKAANLVIRWRKNIAKFGVDEAKRSLISGEFWLIQTYSGDMLQALDENENIEFVFPKEGYIFTADTFVIPADAANVDLAYDFINFMHRPEIAAENMQFVKFRCPNTEALKMLPEKLKNKPSINPAKALWDAAMPTLDLGADTRLYNAAWDKIKSGSGE